jgi:hypothetical protein
MAEDGQIMAESSKTGIIDFKDVFEQTAPCKWALVNAVPPE